MQPPQSILSHAVEKIGWPMSVDYPAASAEDRNAFEDAFTNVLKLQTMLVFMHYDFSLRFMITVPCQGGKD